MNIAICRMALHLAENHSLKGKRQVLSSLTARVRNRFNVSIAEVDSQDRWQLATIGFCCVSNDPQHARQVLSRVIAFIEDEVRGNAEVVDCKTEVLSELP